MKLEISMNALGNVSGNHENSEVYGAEINEVNALTPYYERSIHYVDQKPWGNKNMDKTYGNYLKAINENPVITYRELELKPVSQDKYEFVEDFCGNGTCFKNDRNIIQDKNNISGVQENMTSNNDNNDNKNYYFKMLLILFVIFVIWQLVK
jgi:hypothetical protein